MVQVLITAKARVGAQDGALLLGWVETQEAVQGLDRGNVSWVAMGVPGIEMRE